MQCASLPLAQAGQTLSLHLRPVTLLVFGSHTLSFFPCLSFSLSSSSTALPSFLMSKCLQHAALLLSTSLWPCSILFVTQLLQFPEAVAVRINVCDLVDLTVDQ